MIKSTEPCRGEDCDSLFIQNKKYHLCSNCVYKKNHGGKSQQQVQVEKQAKKINALSNTEDKIYQERFKELNRVLKVGNKEFIISSEEEVQFLKNKQAQDNITETDEGEQRFLEQLRKEREKSNRVIDVQISGKVVGKIDWSKKIKTKKQKPIKQLSTKQSQIEREYKKTCIDMDYTEDKVCSGCLRYQGGEIKLSHSHIISRMDCKGIGRPELISLRENLTYHCMTFSNNKGCHSKWENPKERNTLLDYEKNINFIKSISEEMYNKYKVD